MRREARLGFALEALEFGLLVSWKTRRRGAVLEEGRVSYGRGRCDFSGRGEDRFSDGVVREEGAKEGGNTAKHSGLFPYIDCNSLLETGEVGSQVNRNRKGKGAWYKCRDK